MCPNTKEKTVILENGSQKGRPMLNENFIPEGPYCYTIDFIEYDRNPNRTPKIKLNICPYWQYNDFRTGNAYCTFCDMNGIPYNYLMIEDQCKICGVKDDF